jgi:RimJ/RimL family protein N-acetyltransferase
MSQPARADQSPAGRIALRPARSSDSSLLAFWRSEPSVRRFQPLGSISAQQIRAELARQTHTDLTRRRGDKFQWIVECDDHPAGWITLVVTNWEHGLAEIGYALSTPYQGRGIMPVALGLLVRELFATTEIFRIEARCAVDNVGSQRILERLGFVREGLLRDYFVLRGRRIDNYLYALLADDAAR